MSILFVSLVGIMIVAATSFGTQVMWMHTTRAQMEKERRSTARVELKGAIEGFVEAAKAVELLAEQRFRGEPVPSGAGADNSRMRLTQCYLDVLCTPTLQAATNTHAEKLSDGLWEEMPQQRDFQKYILAARREFLGIAREELRRPEYS